MKTAIVTGAASGIGKGYAVALVEKGYYVLVTDIDEPGAKQVASELDAKGPGRAEALRVDVTDAEAVAAAVHKVKDEHGRLDMIYNNAGLGVGGPAQELTLEHWNKAVDVMVMGVIHGVDAAYKVMVEQGHGHIVNTASVAGFVPVPYMAPYNMAKHAVVGLSMSLRAEAAAHGVRVTCVCPIAVNTNILLNTNAGLDHVAEEEYIHTIYRMLGEYARFVPSFILDSPESHGRKVLRGVERNQFFVISPWFGRPVWWLERAAPALPVIVGGLAARGFKFARPYIPKL